MVLGEQQNITKNQENSLEPPTGFEPATCSLPNYRFQDCILCISYYCVTYPYLSFLTS